MDPYEQAFKISESAIGAVDFIDFLFEEAFLNHEIFDERIINLFQAYFLIVNVPYAKNAGVDEMTGIIKNYVINNKISKIFTYSSNIIYYS